MRCGRLICPSRGTTRVEQQDRRQLADQRLCARELGPRQLQLAMPFASGPGRCAPGRTRDWSGARARLDDRLVYAAGEMQDPADPALDDQGQGSSSSARSFRQSASSRRSATPGTWHTTGATGTRPRLRARARVNSFRAGPVPVEPSDERERDVSVRQRFVELNAVIAARRAGDETVSGRGAQVDRDERTAVRESACASASVGSSVTTLEQCPGVLERIPGPDVEEIPATQIQLIGLGIHGVALDERFRSSRLRRSRSAGRFF